MVWHKVRTCGLRLTLRRPWYTAGEGEELGILLWPPPDAVLPPTGWTQSPDAPTLAVLREEDIRPLGPFISAWGRDPLRVSEPGDAPTAFALPRGDLMSRGDPFTAEDLVLVPLQGEAAPTTDASAELASELKLPACLLRVPPRYDVLTGLWFADFAIREQVARRVTDRFIHLGLVRYQPHAREDVPAGARRSIRCSLPTTAWTVLLPRREVRVTLARDV